MREKIETCTAYEELLYYKFKMIVKERLSPHQCIVDVHFTQEEYDCTMPNLLLSYVEISSQAYVSLFPIEEAGHPGPNELGSSEALSHLTCSQFIMIS